jgi:L-ascorbate metabolism protein UlaG (beta-lactamase superfamily)
VSPEGVHVLIDPFLSQNPYSPIKVQDLRKVDLILATHGAWDHVGDTAEIAAKFHSPVVCGADVKALMEDRGVDPDLLRVTIWGMWMKVQGVQVRPVESHHWSFSKTKDGRLLSGPAIGYILETEPGVRIYHPGDTALSMDLKLYAELYKPTVGLMHVSLPGAEGLQLPHHYMYQSGELTPYEAALACQWLNLKHVIPSHYVDPDVEDVRQFVRIMESIDQHDGTAPRVTVMAPGETIILSPETTGQPQGD